MLVCTFGKLHGELGEIGSVLRTLQGSAVTHLEEAKLIRRIRRTNNQSLDISNVHVLARNSEGYPSTSMLTYRKEIRYSSDTHTEVRISLDLAYLLEANGLSLKGRAGVIKLFKTIPV